MSDIYKLQYANNTLTYPGWNGYVSYEVQPFKTLTLLNSEGGTLTANTLTGYPGDTINLSTSYNTYWRFSGYQLTGDGSLVGNDYTFGTEDATICACYKPNAFTATGGFEKGSDVECAAAERNSKEVNIGEKYAIRNASTGDIPASWYSNSNRWHPSNASAYKINLNTKMYFTTTASINTEKTRNGCTVVSLVGSTENQKQTYAGKPGLTYSYNKSFTSESQDYYGVSARMTATGWVGGFGGLEGRTSRIKYIATGTNGSWTATGYAP